eukprot:1197015-Rhodomonas_salina.7
MISSTELTAPTQSRPNHNRVPVEVRVHGVLERCTDRYLTEKRPQPCLMAYQSLGCRVSPPYPTSTQLITNHQRTCALSLYQLPLPAAPPRWFRGHRQAGNITWEHL